MAKQSNAHATHNHDNIETPAPAPTGERCPIPGCTHQFQAGVRGWAMHVESMSNHPQWHPELEWPENRRIAFQVEFPEWLERGIAYRRHKSGVEVRAKLKETMVSTTPPAPTPLPTPPALPTVPTDAVIRALAEYLVRSLYEEMARVAAPPQSIPPTPSDRISLPSADEIFAAAHAAMKK